MLPRAWVEGRLTGDPALRFAPSGVAVCSFTVVANDRKKNDATNTWEDVNPTFFRCTAFKQLGENVAESLKKGHLVIVGGKLQQRTYTNKAGEEQTSYQEIVCDTVGAALVFDTVTVNKADRGSQQSTAAPPAEDPWASAPDDQPPF